MDVGYILKTGGAYTLIGMGTVFLVLIIIMCVIMLLGKVPGLRPKEEEPAPEPAKAAAAAAAVPAAAAVSTGGDEELVAVITAALAAHLAQEQPGVTVDIADGDYIVRSIRRATWKHI